MTTKVTKALITRTRNLIAQLASGEHDMDGSFKLKMRINANTLKLDRAGEQTVADQLMAEKIAAGITGERARAEANAARVEAARAECREAARNDPTAWMRR